MKIKLLFFDMEGTIFTKQHIPLQYANSDHQQSLWARLMFELGAEAQGESLKTIVKWDAGIYSSYVGWCDESVRILQKYNLTRDLFEKTLNSIGYNPGVKETFGILHKQGIKTALISGGFIEQAWQAQQDLKITHAFAATELFWDDNGFLMDWKNLPSDYEGKVDFMRLLMCEYGLHQDECGFIGDGKNDISIAQKVGLSFAYQAHPELQEVVTYQISNLTKILEYIV
jgi:phosphoserine phosphatase